MCRDRKRRVTLVSGTVHPDVLQTVKTYCYGTGDGMLVIPAREGRTDTEALRSLLEREDISGVLVQQPNFFGLIEDAEGMGRIIHAADRLHQQRHIPL